MKNEEKKKRKNPYGVRINEAMLEKIKKDQNLTTPQQVINFLIKLYEQTFCPIVGVPTYERNVAQTPHNSAKKSENAQKEQPAGRHRLWQEGDPRENTGAFFLKYEANNYAELEQKVKN